MSLATWFNWNQTIEEAGNELPEIFPVVFKKDYFVQIDIINIYTKILTDVIERVNGVDETLEIHLWDNCLASNSSEGLVTMLAKAMADKSELFLVYDSAIEVLRVATADEKNKIREDYKKAAKSDTGVFISFKNYNRSDMVKLYSGLEWSTIISLDKNQNLSKAIQIKINNLRGSVSLADASQAKAQAKAIAVGLSKGKDVLLDAADSIVTATPDLSATKTSIEFLDAKRSFYLGLPISYINGEQTGGLGTTGENDTKAIERGLKNYYFSIIKPVIEALFDVSLTYKSQDFRQIGQALEAMKTFELVGDEYLSYENKKKIIEGLLDIDEDDNETEQTDPETLTLGSARPNAVAVGVKV